MRYNRQGHNIIHRGLAKKTFKENSIKAFKFCFKKNYGIETDLHTTLDNKIVCYHDFSLKRFKSKKLIKNLMKSTQSFLVVGQQGWNLWNQKTL